MPVVWGRFNFPITSKDLGKAFLEEYHARANRNDSQRLRRNDHIRILHRFSPSFLDEDFYSIQSKTYAENASKCPTNPTRPTQRERLDEFDALSSQGVELELITPLHREYGRFAQVWRSCTPKGDSVIVKIFQSCFASDSPIWLEPEGILFFVTEEEQAHREMWAYHTLSTLQGLIIPHSYGFYQITLPSGDNATVHVMEDISGIPLSKLLADSPFERQLNCDEIMTEIASSALDIHKLGVIHWDLEPRNMIRSDERPIYKTVVIDFGMAIAALSDKEGRPRDVIRLERSLLFGWFDRLFGSYKSRMWIEKTFLAKGHDEDWQSFLIDMDPRNITEWKPYGSRDWKKARDSDDKFKKRWEGHEPSPDSSTWTKGSLVFEPELLSLL